MYHKISSIMLNSEQRSSNASEVFVSHPDEHKESLAGKLFVLLEIESQKSNALKINNFLINNINYNYYQNEKVLLREKISNLKVEHIFETALANVNKDLIEFLQQEKIKISPYAINITVGVIYDNHIYLSSLGKNKNFLIYPVKSKQGEEEYYKITDIEKGQEKAARAVSLTKLFSDVVSGPLPENGYYFLANEALTEHLSEKQMIETITKLPPASAAIQIRNIVQQIKVPVNFLGVIIKNTTNTDERSEEEDAQEASRLFDLDETKEETEKILKPSGVINLKDLARKSSQLISRKRPSPESAGKTDKENKQDREVQKKMEKINSVFSKTASGLGRLIQAGINKLSFLKPENNVFVRSDGQNNWIKKIAKEKKKIILAGVFIFLVALGLSIYSSHSEEKTAESLEDINLLIEESNKKLSLAEANLLYGNEEEARNIMKEAEESLSELESMLVDSSFREEKESEYKKLVERMEEQNREIQRVVYLDSPEKLVSLTDSNYDSQGENIFLTDFGLCILDSQNSSIYKIDPEDGQIRTLDIMTEGVEINGRYVTETSDSLYYLTDQGVIELDPEDDSINHIDIDIPPNFSPGGIGGYIDNIYLLDRHSDQIYLYQKTYDDLQSRSEWMDQTDSRSFQNIEDIAIDGYIYTLDRSGEVKQYLSGELQDFSLNEISPDWGRATKIKTSPTMGEGSVYILDSNSNRIVVFNKHGEFLRQYQNEEKFKNIKDFHIDEEREIIYLLDDNSVYSHPLKKDAY